MFDIDMISFKMYTYKKVLFLISPLIEVKEQLYQIRFNMK